MDKGQMEHRNTQRLKLQDSLIIKLSHVKLHNGFTTRYLDHHICQPF